MARLLRRRAPPAPAEPEKFYPTITEPQEKGLEMLMGGEFGRLSNKYYEQNPRRGPRNLARLVRERHIAKRRMPAADLASNIRPNSSGTIVAAYRENANAYSGQFSADSSFYYTCCHDFRLHVYDTTAPLRKKPQKFVDHETTMKVIKTIQGYPVSWTITDSHLSSDNQRLIYAAIAPQLFMTSTTDSDTSHHVIDFTDTGARRGRIRGRIVNEDHFGLWSCRFSADDKEIVAGGDGNIFVYDLVGDRRTVRISAHSDDVNSCCWADTASGNVLISASDDSFIKVWDRRSLGSSPKPSGVLVGHTEGITYVSPKGDGRYVISNGKDQALRLWDLRMMRSNQEYETFAHRSYGVRGYDYRMGDYHKPKFSAHPKDCSVMVYSGHAVYRTLIRCHFSPTESTGAQYIYSGSADGKIHARPAPIIWSLDGQIVEVLDRQQTLPMVMDPSAADPVGKLLRKPRRVCVRDVSWHSQEPVLMSTAWEGQRGYGGDSTIARHEWKGLLKTGSGTGAGLLEDHVEKREKEQEEVSTRRYTRLPQTSAVPGAFGSYDVEEDDDDSEWMDEDD
ncbi:WD40 repeat-like protein [Sistotremastrum suecicum HHB10207 ss-3]|uniref:WD40 repeat-like protein n=1 Tax=Sistotremastrum suecicum HHB10207 ss-3 TaxID=1314776 RepID=A0A166G829_9AGAM|nr:WD40 repeat-like protein [Sistotremastrum suecicum HHB10207 ss-3]